jgi:hypothetical protein
LIISILASLILGVAAIAAETAREASTRHTVERLHTLLTDFYGMFKTRRVRLRQDDSTTGAKGIETQIGDKFKNNPSARGQALAEARLYAMRELMLTEVPDRWSDVLLTASGDPSNPSGQAKIIPLQPFYLSGRTELANAYLRYYLNFARRTNTLSGQTNTEDEVKRNQGAECLYMVVTMACGDGEARTLFSEKNIGDSDGDGAPEFLDGWGHPINFLRWAPGFDSQIELNKNALDQMKTPDALNAIARDHDPFDLFRRDPLAFRLVPLIYSPGRDESSGLNAAEDYVTWRQSTAQTMTFGSSAPYILSPVLSPYLKGAPLYPDAYLGTDLNLFDPSKYDETSTDNIHNHLMGQR